MMSLKLHLNHYHFNCGSLQTRWSLNNSNISKKESWYLSSTPSEKKFINRGIIPPPFLIVELNVRYKIVKILTLIAEKNKARYTATQVACRWAGAIFEVTPSFGPGQ